MAIQAQSTESIRASEFRNAHILWQQANASFHGRFQEIIAAGTCQDLDVLADDLADKFNNFMSCSKALVAGK
ncbi:MAG: hypothetical protein V4693_04700 [Pseudomonadota bacterium]